MRRIAIMATMLMANSAVGQWNGWPLAENTNAYTWTAANKLYSPQSQLWYAAQERYVVKPDEENPGGALIGYTVPAGYSNAIVVTNGVTYTNIILLTTNIGISYSFTGSPTNYGDFVYTYSDLSGMHTATGSPTIVKLFQIGNITNTQSILIWMDYAIHDSYEFASDLRTIDQYVSTNPSVGGTYDTYFSTPAAGTYPSAFLDANRANIFYYEGIGITSNLTTNVWGWVTGSDNYNRDAMWFASPIRTQNYTLAESHYTGAWSFVDVNAFVQNIEEDNLAPAWNYDTWTNALTPVNFLVTGTVYGAWDWDGEAGSGVNVTRTTVATSETVAVSSSNGVLSGEWYDITGISSANSATNYNVFSIYYTNVPASYSWRWPAPYRRLYAENLDNIKTVINAMQWTDAGTLSWTADSANNQYIWTGNSTSSWADAKSVAEAAAPAVSTVNTLSESGTEGSYSAPTWTAVATTRKSKLVTPALPTNSQHQLNWYVKGTTNDIGIYDDFGYGVSNGYYQLFSTNTPTYDNVVTQAVGIGSTSFPPTWCAEPFVGTNTARGYKVNGQLGLSKWLFKFRN